jgi:hypothetical protein
MNGIQIEGLPNLAMSIEPRWWNSGPPPHIGWWNASYAGRFNEWHWWNGTAWSYAALDTYFSEKAEESARYVSNFCVETIMWTNYWPANARVERIKP